jgi:stage V sporulation protein R
MKKQDLQRLSKLEDRINQIAKDELGLSYPDIEYDICSPEKFLEISSYRYPGNISHWSYGKSYDRLRTIYDEVDASLPYEVVINSTPPRAYLLDRNTLAIHALVIAHVCGHVHFFANNKFFKKQRNDIIEFMSRASERFLTYEKKYGIDSVEPIIDAGLSLQFHSDPFDEETEDQKRKRIYEQTKKSYKPSTMEYYDLLKVEEKEKKVKEDIESFNSKLWQKLKNKIPVEPTEDILRFIIDRSHILDNWQKDILETLREEGRYFHPIIKTKLMNEGFASHVHNRIMIQLFNEGLLNAEDHGQYSISNSLVKAKAFWNINPYLVGSRIFEDIEDRWNKGKHGPEWSNCFNIEELEKWDTKEGKGWQKCLEVVNSYSDWLFLQDFLTNQLVEDLELFIYEQQKLPGEIRLVRTKFTTDETRQLIIMSYAYNYTPKIEIVDGRTNLVLKHSHFGTDLDYVYTFETMKHIQRLWGGKVILETIQNGEAFTFCIMENGEPKEIEKMSKAAKEIGGISINLQNLPLEAYKQPPVIFGE